METRMSNPLLENTVLPRFSAIRPEHVEPAIDTILADYQAGIDALLAAKTPRSFENVIGVCEDLDDRLSRAWAPVGHLHGVADSEALREAYAKAQEKIVAFSSALGQNRELYAAVKAVREAAAFATLPAAARTLVEHELRDFVLAGVALEEPARSRYREISSELARLSTEFEEAVLDATDAWSEHITDAAGIAGIPESGRAVLRAYAEEKGLEGWLVTLKQPSVQAVLSYADDRALRARVYRAYGTRASENADGGKFDNTARIERILALRHESALLLGFASTAEESLATKMATSPEQVIAFLRDFVAKARPMAEADLAELRAFAAEHLQIADLQPWDVGYASEKLRERKYALNEEELKPYFPLPAVMDGLFAVIERVLGVGVRLLKMIVGYGVLVSPGGGGSVGISGTAVGCTRFSGRAVGMGRRVLLGINARFWVGGRAVGDSEGVRVSVCVRVRVCVLVGVCVTIPVSVGVRVSVAGAVVRVAVGSAITHTWSNAVNASGTAFEIEPAPHTQPSRSPLRIVVVDAPFS